MAKYQFILTYDVDASDSDTAWDWLAVRDILDYNQYKIVQID